MSGMERAVTEIACIHVRFAEQAAETPHAQALSFGPARLTYRALNESANRLARLLCEFRVIPDQVVAIHLDRSSELVIAMLAILKAGAAYLPLDPTYPADRLAFMMRDQDVKILITDRHVPASLSRLAEHVLVVPDVFDLAVDRGDALNGGTARQRHRLVPKANAQQRPPRSHTSAGQFHADTGIGWLARSRRDQDAIIRRGQCRLDRNPVVLFDLDLGAKTQQIIDEGEGEAVVIVDGQDGPPRGRSNCRHRR